MIGHILPILCRAMVILVMVGECGLYGPMHQTCNAAIWGTFGTGCDNIGYLQECLAPEGVDFIEFGFASDFDYG